MSTRPRLSPTVKLVLNLILLTKLSKFIDRIFSTCVVKDVPGDDKRSTAGRELAIQQIVSRAVVSTEIVDIMKAAGLASPVF